MGPEHGVGSKLDSEAIECCGNFYCQSCLDRVPTKELTRELKSFQFSSKAPVGVGICDGSGELDTNHLVSSVEAIASDRLFVPERRCARFKKDFDLSPSPAIALFLVFLFLLPLGLPMGFPVLNVQAESSCLQRSHCGSSLVHFNLHRWH